MIQQRTKSCNDEAQNICISVYFQGNTPKRIGPKDRKKEHVKRHSPLTYFNKYK